jgi:hypothetical protein
VESPSTAILSPLGIMKSDQAQPVQPRPAPPDDAGPILTPTKAVLLPEADPAATISIIVPPASLIVTPPTSDPIGEIIDRLHGAIDGGTPPDLLQLGGEEQFEAYRGVFNRLYDPSQPIFDPQGRVIVFDDDYCRHVCYCEERFDKRRKRAEGEERVRTSWDQSRAEHILWILAALTRPSLIAHNNQQGGNLAYLLGYPRGETSRPTRRYYASVKPTSPKRAIFKTAYTITQEQWDQALRAPRHRRGQPHILYRAPTPRW